MNGTEFKFDVGERVKLRGEVDPSFYDGMAKTGNEGWIGGHRRDRFGLPEVFIRWDPNHWAYNRQPDQWTFQDHFDLVEERKVPDQSPHDAAVQQALSQFAEQLGRVINDATSSSAPQPRAASERSSDSQARQAIADLLRPPAAEREQAPEYLAHIQKANDILPGSEAFMCISVVRKPSDKAELGELRVEVSGDSLTPEAESLLGAHLATFAAQFHRASAMMNIEWLAQRETQERNG